jgi:hypothetical protein
MQDAGDFDPIFGISVTVEKERLAHSTNLCATP